MNPEDGWVSGSVARSVCFLTLAAMLLRCCCLDLHSLWTDEGHSMAVSGANTLVEQWTVLRSLRNSDVYQPGYHFLLHLWRRLFGDSAIALRSLSALCGSVSVPLMFVASRRFFNQRCAFWATTFLSVSAFAVYYSQEVRCYAWLLLLSLCQLWFVGRIVGSRSQHNVSIDAAIFGLISAVGFFSSPVTLPFTAALICAYLIVYANVRKTFEIVGWTVLFLLPAAAYFITLPGRVSPSEVAMNRTATPLVLNAVFVGYGILAGTTLGPPIDLLRSAHRWQAVARYLPILSVLAACTFILFVVAVMRWRRLCRQKYRQSVKFFLLTHAFATVFGLAIVLLTRMNWTPRHSYYLLIPMAMLLPTLFVNDNEGGYGQSRLQAVAGFAGFVGLIVLNLISLGRYFFDPAHRRDDYRGMVRCILAQRAENDCSLSFFTCAPLLRYYGDSSTTVVITREALAKALDSCAAGNAQRIWLSVWRDAELPCSAIASVIPPRYRISSRQTFRNIGVYSLKLE